MVNSAIINTSHIIQHLGAPELPNKFWPIHFWLYTVEDIKYMYKNTRMLKNLNTCGYILSQKHQLPKKCKYLTSRNLHCLSKWKGDGGKWSKNYEPAILSRFV